MDYSHWKSHFESQLLTQADDEYAVTRRIWNGMIDKKPALIARCASAADVRAGVRLARAERMTISVQGRRAWRGGKRSLRRRNDAGSFINETD
jgi:hypothetical protein